MPRTAQTAVLALLSVALFALTVGGVAAAGVRTSMRDSYGGTRTAASLEIPPAAPVSADGRLVVAVTLGATGTVVADALAPYDVFARSPHFRVITVADRRAPVALSGGIAAVPDHTFADVDAGRVPAPDVVVVPAVVDPFGVAEAPLRTFVAHAAARGARILGVCSGARVLAAAGVLDGRRATSFWNAVAGLRSDYPGANWVDGQRYVEDGSTLTTAGVTSGIVGALRLVEVLAGPAEADRIGREVAYPGWNREAPTAIPVHRLGPSDLPYGLNVAFPWGRPTVGIGLVDDVGELDAAAAFEVYGATSFASRTVPLAAGPTVRTRHGLVLLAPPVNEHLDRVVVPGVQSIVDVGTTLRDRADRDGAAIVLPHARSAFESAFTPLLRDLASDGDRATATTTAAFLEYPLDPAELTGPAWPWRPTLLAAVTLALGGAAAAAPHATTRLIQRRRAER